MAYLAEQVNLYDRLTELLGEVNSKKLFSGIGIFHNTHMFGIFKQGGFYLRAKGELAEQLQKIGAVRWDLDGIPSNLKIRDYYLMPSGYVVDEDKQAIFLKMLHTSIKQVEEGKLAEALENAKKIRRLPNLSLKYERLLAKVGIETIAQLREIGAADAYILIKSHGYFVTCHMFWKTYAALKNTYVELLTEKDKDLAFKEINEKLKIANMRAMTYRP